MESYILNFKVNLSLNVEFYLILSFSARKLVTRLS